MHQSVENGYLILKVNITPILTVMSLRPCDIYVLLIKQYIFRQLLVREFPIKGILLAMLIFGTSLLI